MQSPGIFHKSNAQQKTGIVLACQLGSAREVRRMLEMGCDPHETNAWNEEAIIVAAKNNSPSCVRVLLDAGVSISTKSPTGKSIKDYADVFNNQDMHDLISEYERDHTPSRFY